MKVRGKQKGFTLLEMMIVVAILGILAAMAYPSFQYTSAVNRAKLGESEINKALAYARSEAISRNKYIGVCPMKSDNSELCAVDPDDCPSSINPQEGCSWSNGFLVYIHHNPSDLTSTPTLTSDDILQHFYINEKQLIITLETPRLTWKAGGLSLHPTKKNLNDQIITVVPSNDPSSTNYLRQCKIAPTGQTLCTSNK